MNKINKAKKSMIDNLIGWPISDTVHTDKFQNISDDGIYKIQDNGVELKDLASRVFSSHIQTVMFEENIYRLW